VKMVIGVLLNFPDAWAAAEPQMHHAPHFQPPRHPVLYFKPANTWCGDGDDIAVPAGVSEVELGATLGVVIGEPACAVRESEAMRHVAGYRVVNDIGLPETGLLRPPLAQKCRDRFCPMGPVVPADRVADPGKLRIRIAVNGRPQASHATVGLLRSVPQLLSAISEFATLDTGDMVLIGVPANPPRAHSGDKVVVEIDGVGRLENLFCAEGAT